MFDFNEQKTEGKLATKVVELYLLLDPGVKMVETVEDQQEYREKGIDLLVDTAGEKLGVEVKSDTYGPPNCFLEVLSDVERDSAGCFITSEADVWIYYYARQDMALWLPMGPVREFVLSQDWPLREARNRAWSSRGALVPYKEILEAVPEAEVLRNVRAEVERQLAERWAK